jgi:hypothetical protein
VDKEKWKEGDKNLQEEMEISASPIVQNKSSKKQKTK